MTEKERGHRTRVGKLLSNYIRIIAEEETEMVIDPKSGEDRMATKAEALARLIWKKALGWTELKIVGDEPTDIQHHPDKYLMGLLFDRMEGRAPLIVGDGDGDGRMTTAEKVSEQGLKRIANAGELDKEQ